MNQLRKVSHLLRLAWLLLPLSASAATVDHFEFSPQGPGTKNGSHPYAVFAGQCQQMTVTAKDSAGNVVTTYSGDVVVKQWLINYQTGALLQPAPGISEYRSIGTSAQLGLSSITVTMTNGVFTFGPNGDLSTQLCFYYATRDPQDYNQSPSNPQQNGDLVLQATLPDGSKPGDGASYLGWHNTSQKLILTVPLQGYAPATSNGSTGTISPQNLGSQFTMSVRLTDAYWNQVFDDKNGTTASDTVQFTASNPNAVSISPFQGAMTQGYTTAFATIISSTVCNSTISLTASDITSPSKIAASSVNVYISTCTGGNNPPPPPPTQNPGYYQLSVPGVGVAGSTFPITIIVNNVNISNIGGLRYSGRLIPLIATSGTTFAPASGVVGIPTFDFTIPQGIVQSSYTVTIPTQSYTVAQTIWIQLVADNPAALSGASAIAGPILILPGTPTRITGSASPSTLGALSASSIKLSMLDAFGNPIPSQTFVVEQTAGTQGDLSGVGPGLIQQILTDASGNAFLTFTSGRISESIMIQASAPSYPAIPTASIPLTVTLLGSQTIAAYPSPVMITQRPITIEYKLSQNSDVKLTITDLFGQEVWKASYSAGGTGGAIGFNRITWDGKNGRGTLVASGVYVVHMEATANGQKASTAKYRFGVKK